jgi:predicted Fe-Mo cluster-binding NifX family protein
MKDLKIAVPTDNPGGMAANRSDHFGHCDLFTVIDLQDGKIARVETFPNAEHGAGGCLVPVKLLKEHNVDALVVGGMGMRPLQGFNDVGIVVYYAPRDEYQNVLNVIEGFLQDKLPVMHPQQACRGNDNCQH